MARVRSKRLRREAAGSASFDELEQSLKIDRDNLDDALLVQAEAFHRIAKAFTLTKSRRDAAKQAIAELKWQNGMRSSKTLQQQIHETARTLLALNAELGRLQALKDAFKQRSYALKDLSNLYLGGYFGAELSNPGSKLAQRREAERIRRVMNEQRHRRLNHDG